MRHRRDFFARVAGLGAGLFAARAAAQHQHPAATNIPVETPDLPKLPHKLIDGVKEFHLIAEVVRTEFMPGRVADAWGFNGSVPGPTIEINQGDRVRVIFENRLPEMSAVHWHGFEVPMEQDGSVGLGQDPVPPGGRHVYEFTLNQHGTYFYHSHFAMQEMMGMIGLFIMHPKAAYTPPVDRDFGLILQEWALLPNNTVPNTLAMEFNWLTINGKSAPSTTPMLVKLGERVRIRMVNMGMDHHPMHLHGNTFTVTGTEAGRAPVQTWFDQNTVLVGVAQARDIEFDAKYVGDWMLHCHLPHHMMNQMMSMVGPITHLGHGLHTGAGMEEGMGIIRQSGALAEELGPALGRGLGVAADAERATSNLVAQAPSQHPQHAAGPARDLYPKDDPEKKKIPGYPQDMWMPLDELAGDKPENHGLRKGWSGAMMGMMTLVRVLPPSLFDKIAAMRKEKKDAPPPQHHHPPAK
ncbi:MAG: multicopper oxidase family protein [Bryobacteraceae bacterium]